MRGPRLTPRFFLQLLDPKIGKIVLEVYKGHPILALGLARQLTAIRQPLERGRKGITDTIEVLDLAIDGPFDHTDSIR